jgi:tRNA (guanine-N7-)-methyltransferase
MTRTFITLIDEIPPDSRSDQLHYFKNLFGTSNPLVVEIGSGNGHFLVEYALQHPEKNCIGTEILGGRARKFHKKIEKNHLSNTLIYKGDARRFVWEFLFEKTVQEFIIMFPDPWPKKRHHKHRLLQYRFIKMLGVRLVPGGRISITTDDPLFRDWLGEEFRVVRTFRTLYSNGYTLYPENYPKSLFEERFRKENKNIFFLQYEKI